MNEFVTIVGKYSPTKYKAEYDYIKENDLILEVTKTLKTRAHLKVLKEYNIRDLQYYVLSIPLKNINKVSENFIDKSIKKYKDNKEKALNDKLNFEYIPVKSRVFEHFQEKNFLNTNINFVNFLDLQNKIIKSEARYLGTCCSFTKTLNKIKVYIPKLWLTYFGYKKEDLVNYLEFLEKCNINFKIKNIEEINIKEFESDFNINLNENSPNRIVNNVFIGKNGFYTIEFENNKKSTWVNYLYFILIRYMYCSLYWNIPGNAMKFKHHMPELTEWECLLLANSKENYNGYYSLNTLADNQVLDICNPIEKAKKLENNTNYGLNHNFSVVTNKELRKAIEEENFEFIKNYIIKNRK